MFTYKVPVDEFMYIARTDLTWCRRANGAACAWPSAVENLAMTKCRFYWPALRYKKHIFLVILLRRRSGEAQHVTDNVNMLLEIFTIAEVDLGRTNQFLPFTFSASLSCSLIGTTHDHQGLLCILP